MAYVPRTTPLDHRVARLLSVGTYISITLLALGVITLLGSGRSPLEDGPPLVPARLPADVLAGRPEGFLWLGLLAVIATPTARVLLTLAAYIRLRERPMIVVAAVILGIIALSVTLALGARP